LIAYAAPGGECRTAGSGQVTDCAADRIDVVEAAIRDLLVQTAARTLKLPEDELDADSNVMALGMTSSQLVGIASSLQDALNIEINPTVFFGQPGARRRGSGDSPRRTR
jgi:acyl carrier protein